MLSTFMVVLFVLVELNNMILIKLNGKDYGKYTQVYCAGCDEFFKLSFKIMLPQLCFSNSHNTMLVFSAIFQFGNLFHNQDVVIIFLTCHELKQSQKYLQPKATYYFQKYEVWTATCKLWCMRTITNSSVQRTLSKRQLLIISYCH